MAVLVSGAFLPQVTVVDFTVTPAGLEDQLLARLVLRERRELEEQRRRLAGEVQACRARVADLEADLLSRLSTSTGNLLDDTALIDVLAGTKATAREAGERLAVAADTRGRIDAACEEFRPAAHRATLLYFLVAEFAGINCMYQVRRPRGGMGLQRSRQRPAASSRAKQD